MKRNIGSGRNRGGLYYLDLQPSSSQALSCATVTPDVYPFYKLVCDVCDRSKHARHSSSHDCFFSHNLSVFVKKEE
ncbi:hypothetical protein KSP39_PZI008962 [Platanthera zijinensis]|uniref:Uncharacterized protein n=1 Tax=Platanthera zijinensis TaxID=2320716 RepID=A0AAP0BLZ3_9ASPA